MKLTTVIGWLMAVLLTGCGSGDSGAPADADDSPREILINMTEFSFEPSTIHVSAGETVRFVLANDGLVEHQFWLTTRTSAEQRVASDPEGGPSTEVSVIVDPGAIEIYEYTFSADMPVDAVACLIPGHFEAGMVASVEVGGLSG